MKTLKISRLEGIYAICEDAEKSNKNDNKNGKLFAIPISELPKGCRAGDRVLVDDELGTLTVEKKEPR